MTHSHCGLIAVSGPDAEKFLQGQFSCDVREVTSQQSRLGAYCNQQGRVQASFRLFKHDNNYYLLLPVSMVQPTLSLLQKYALFSKVTLSDATNTLSLTKIPGNTPEEQITLDIDNATWERSQIQAGVPVIYPQTIGLFTPQMLNYDQLNAVSFNKGCYMGQEIVARTHYLGHAKQHLYQLELSSPTLPGDAIFTHEQIQAGTVVNSAPLDSQGGYILLAVLNDALAEKVACEKLISYSAR